MRPLGINASADIAASRVCYHAGCDTLFLRRASGTIVKQRVSRLGSVALAVLNRGPNAHGDVLFGTAEGYRKAGVWVSADAEEAALPGHGRYSDALAMNDARNAVGSGESLVGRGPVRPIFWLAESGIWTAKRMGSVLQVEPEYAVMGPSGEALDINNVDDVVGRMSVNGANGGFIWSHHLRGGLVPLNTLFFDDMWDVTSAHRISNNRRIAAHETNKQSGERWVVLPLAALG